MIISVTVSVGELLDKISILRVKSRKVKNESKLAFINAELELLLNIAEKHQVLDSNLLAELESVNEALWLIEDDIRVKERDRDFGQDFIELARAVYVTNDIRFNIKNKVNEKYNSDIREQKDYVDYQND